MLLHWKQSAGECSGMRSCIDEVTSMITNSRHMGSSCTTITTTTTTTGCRAFGFSNYCADHGCVGTGHAMYATLQLAGAFGCTHPWECLWCRLCSRWSPRHSVVGGCEHMDAAALVTPPACIRMHGTVKGVETDRGR